jgi:magnesium chelatase family protein
VLATVLSATVQGLEGRVIRVEVDVAPGLPGFSIVGLADTALLEARERVRGAIRNSGFVFPPRRITVNLAPADLRKAGSSLDLGIAIAILLGSEQVHATRGRWALVGEVSLGGEVRHVPGLLPMLSALARRGVTRAIVPLEGLAEARLVAGIDVRPAATLSEAVEVVRAPRTRPASRGTQPERVELTADEGSREGPTASDGGAGPMSEGPPPMPPDFAEVRGQAEAKRALEIALAGGHGLLMIGPPGSGKTLLARTIPGLLPPLDDDEALRATIVESVAARGRIEALVRRRPFRSPHHTISYAGMVGGGPRLSPGEVTLAHNGVLFLDELPEFDRDVLEALREPLEEGRIAITRVGRGTVFPARFQLVGAMNPCPCGQTGSETEACRCRPGVPERYAARISGPLRDRIDLWVEMARVPPVELVQGLPPESSAAVAARIVAARTRQLVRGPGNARLSGRRLLAVAQMTADAEDRLVALAELEVLSARGTERLLRVARTIADLAGTTAVDATHLEEAARFRRPARRLADRAASA